MCNLNMTPERAKFLLSKLHCGEFPMAFPREYVLGGGRIDPQGITETEDQEIRQLWETMPGHTCYYDAVQRIARGQTVPTHTPEQRSQMETYRP